MKSLFLGVLFGLPAIVGTLSSTARQSDAPPTAMIFPACHPSDSFGLDQRRFYRVLVTDPDTNIVNQRKSLDLPAVLSSQVELVDDSTTCVRARNAFQTSIGDTSNLRQVYVLSIGPTRYIVTDTALSNQRSVDIAYDTAFVEKARVLR